MRHRVAWAGIALLAVYLVFIGGGWLGIYRSDLRVATVALTAVLLLGWAAAARRDPAWRPRSALSPALAICLASLALSTALSRDVRISLEYLGYAVLLVALYLLLVRLMADPFFRPRLLILGALLFGALVLELVGGVVLLWIQWWAIGGQVVRPPLRPYFIGLGFGNPSAVLTMVALLAVPAGLLAARSRWRVAGLGVIAVAVGIVAVLSGSRSGWLGLAVAFGLVGLAWLLWGDGRVLAGTVVRRLRSGPIPRAWIAAGVGAAGVLAVAAVVLVPSVLRRVEAGGEDLRTIFVVTALRLFGESPIVGTGPGTWAIERISVTQAGEIDYYVPHAHDVPAQTLAELGVLGGLAGLLLLGAVVWLVWRAMRSEDLDRRWLAYLTAIALVYFAVHNVLDFYANMPAALFAVALPIAYLDATSADGSGMLARAKRLPGVPPLTALAPWALAAACALAVTGLLVYEAPAMAGERAVVAADAGDWATAFGDASLAAGQDPDVHPYALTAGIAAAHLGDEATAARYLQIVAAEDGLPEAWLDFGAVELRRGNEAAALDALHAALRLGSQRAPIAMAAGGLLLQLGQVDEARAAFATAVAIRPSLAGDPWWQSPAVAAAVPSIEVLALPIAAPGDRWEIALVAGDVTGATTYATDPGAPPIAPQVIAAWSDPAAAAALYAACRSDPIDLDRLRWCARIAGHLGDPTLADRFRAVAEGIAPGSSEGGAELRVAVGDDQRVPTTQLARYWGLYTYARPTPADLLVPGLIHLVLA